VDAEPRADVVVLDTIGELAQLYQVATVVFVGGSLVDAGGHNILEPAVHGKPIVFGPHMQNFAEIARLPRSHGAACRCVGPASSPRRCSSCSGDPVRRASLGAAARALVEANRGAKASGACPSSPSCCRRARRAPCCRSGWCDDGARHTSRARGPPHMLSAIYAAIVRRRRERYAARPDLRRRLRRPSSASATSPLAAAARRRSSRPSRGCCSRGGERPAILSRGYGRRDRPMASSSSATHEGIRADLDRCRGRAADARPAAARRSVVASPDRYLAGRLAEHHLGATVHILDDGFQHLQLERDIDIVLIAREDVDNPSTLPAGRCASRSTR
jgi:3-deoxy-D-manno-octulosonic-acid transferase